MYEEASNEVLIPLVGTLTHFCKPINEGLGLFLEPRGRVKSYLAVVSAGLNTFCETAGNAAAKIRVIQNKLVLIIVDVLEIHSSG